MNRKFMLVSSAVAGLLLFSPAQAHNPGHRDSSYGGVSGSITIWGGAPHGPGYSGTINYGHGYPVAPPYAGAYFYPSCSHWHSRGYQAPSNHHAYNEGYRHGYVEGYTGGDHGHKKPKHKSHHRHGKGHHR